MEFKTLNNGIKMPMIGFGTYNIPDDEVCQKVLDAIDAGYRLIDTAQHYRNESGVGEAIAKAKVPRKELFITTKIWITNYGYENAKKAIDNSLKRLQSDYIDLCLVHWPYNDYYGAWRAFEEAIDQGKIRAIGVSNFPPEKLEDLMIWNKVKPVINQIECHPFYQRDDEIKFINSNDIAVEAWSGFANGKDGIFTNSVLANIGKKYGKTNGQVILRWQLQRGVVSIPKTVHKERLKENLDIFGFQLSDDDMKQISTLDKDKTLFWNADDWETADLKAELGQNEKPY